jgi:hypothetical protein
MQCGAVCQEKAAWQTGEEKIMLQDFIALSSALTGERALDQSQAQAYMERARAAEPHGQHLEKLIQTFIDIQSGDGDLNEQIEKKIMKDASLGPLARQIIFLWYTSALPSDDGKVWEFGSAQQYFAALMWPAVRAHAPGLSGGYFGHWKYAPDN